MRNRRNNGGREFDDAAYTAEQVEHVLRLCEVEVISDTYNDFLCLCPFHGNQNTPSFSVSRASGKFICFNHSCGVTGSLEDLVVKVTDRNPFQAKRVILKARTDSKVTVAESLKKKFDAKFEFKEFPQEVIDRMAEEFWNTPHAVEYMTKERGFTEDTLRYFKIGYSAKKGIVAVPMHTANGMPVGVIGRPASKTDKFFKNSVGLPTSKTLWNLHRAKRAGGTVIVVESSFDAMRLHQAGYPNVVATLGGNFSPYHLDQLQKYFSVVIIMTDMDEKVFYDGCRKCNKVGLNLCKGHNPGRDLGATIAEQLKDKRVLWASYDTKVIYPHNAKDAGNMTDDEISRCIVNAVSNYQYRSWRLY